MGDCGFPVHNPSWNFEFDYVCINVYLSFHCNLDKPVFSWQKRSVLQMALLINVQLSNSKKSFSYKRFMVVKLYLLSFNGVR